MRRFSVVRSSFLCLVVLLMVAACRFGSTSAPDVPITMPPTGVSTTPSVSGGSGVSPAPSRPSPGQSTDFIRTGAAQPVASRARLQPGTEHNHCRPGSSNLTQTYADPPYEFDAGGEGVPAQSREFITYCGPGAWVVDPYAPTDTYNLPTFTPNISRYVGIPASTVMGGRQIWVDFAERTDGYNPYVFALDARFNPNAPAPTVVRVITNSFRAPAPYGRQVASTSIAGRSYRVYAGSTSNIKVYSFAPEINQTDGTLDLGPYLRYALARGWVPGSASLDYVAYVLEVFKIDGTQPFNCRRFVVTLS